MSSGRCLEAQERRKESFKSRVAVTEKWGDFERWIEFIPGYDHRAFPKDCGGGGHGQHGMEMAWYLRGELGVVQWKVCFIQAVPGNVGTLGNVPVRHANVDDIMAVDLGYHSPKPRWEGQEDYGRMDCDLLPGGECYYDGSGLNAGPVLERFINEGPGAVWSELVDYYHSVFSPTKAPPLSTSQILHDLSGRIRGES